MNTKTKFIPVVASFVIALISCTPINPPQTDEQTSTIINILYKGMGKTAQTCLDPLKDMGIDVPLSETSSSDYEECYYLKNKKYEICIACHNDSILYTRYAYDFRNTYIEGAKQFHKVDDIIYNFGWEEGKVTSPEKTYHDLDQHEANKAEIDSCVAAESSSVCGIFSLYQKKFAEKYMNSSVDYYAVSVGGMDKDTGKGKSSMANSGINILFEIRTIPYIKE